jgi:hypothetical protein
MVAYHLIHDTKIQLRTAMYKFATDCFFRDRTALNYVKRNGAMLLVLKLQRKEVGVSDCEV